MKRIIAVIAGGDSSELPVSLRSAELIYDSIDKEKYEVYIIEMQGLRWEVRLPAGVMVSVDRNDFSFMKGDERVKIDFAYITIHGTPGENGLLQGYFEMIRVPYSCCGVLPAALTFNKFVCNQYLKGFGIRVAESLMVRKGFDISDEEVVDKVGLPCFIKPNQGGSSFGVTKVRSKEQIQYAIRNALEESDEVIIEIFMEGTEVTCGCFKTKKMEKVLPVTEIVSKNDFFDYNAKYNGDSEEITPARISDELTERVQLLTSAIYDILGCAGIIRADYIITEGNRINLLEVNATPGMSKVSLVPQQIRAAGMTIEEVLTEIIEDRFN